MKKVRLITRRVSRELERRTRRLRAWLTIQRVLLIGESLLLGGGLVFALTGGRAALVDALGSRADIWVFVMTLAVLGALHFFVNRRLLGPVLDRRFSVATYDDRRILFDLGQAARGVTNVEQLYELVVGKIEEALHTENVSIFVRDDRTGDYVCRSTPLQTASTSGKIGDQSQNQLPLALARDAFVVKRLRSLGVPLGLEARDFETWARALSSAPPVVREARRREIETLQAIRSRLLMQITMKDRLVGLISLGPRAVNRSFSAEDKRLLMSIATQMAFIIENAKLVERMVEEGRLRRELALASEVQQRLFPARPPETKTLDLSGFCQPAREIGGDYYDFLLLDNEQIGIAVADVAGKGISAALLMSIVQASLRSQAMALNPGIGIEGSLADLVSTMNRLVWRSTGASSYVTFFYAQFDERTRRLTYVNAGHNPPLLIKARSVKSRQEEGAGRVIADARGRTTQCALNGEYTYQNSEYKYQTESALLVEENSSGAATSPSADDAVCCTTPVRLTEGGPVIGVFEDCFYRQETIELESGDLLVAYTDGVTEALNREGEEFGEARLQETLIGVAHLSADEVRNEVVRSVRVWCESAPQHDDLTFIVMKVR